MRKYFFILAILSLSICVSSCFNKNTEENTGYQESAGTSEGTGEVTSVADLPQYPKQDIAKEASPSVSGDVGAGGEASAVGPFVRPSEVDIQTALKNAGYYTGNIDGKIGPLSEKAIKDFQAANGLTADGKVGRKTWAILKGYLISASE